MKVLESLLVRPEMSRQNKSGKENSEFCFFFKLNFKNILEVRALIIGFFMERNRFFSELSTVKI